MKTRAKYLHSNANLELKLGDLPDELETSKVKREQCYFAQK